MILEVIYKMYQSVEQFTDIAYIIAWLLHLNFGRYNSFGSIANIKTVTKYLKGNQKLDPQKGVNTGTAKVSRGGRTLMIQMPMYSSYWWKD